MGAHGSYAAMQNKLPKVRSVAASGGKTKQPARGRLLLF
jgi:hypothetical protein